MTQCFPSPLIVAQYGSSRRLARSTMVALAALLEGTWRSG